MLPSEFIRRDNADRSILTLYAEHKGPAKSERIIRGVVTMADSVLIQKCKITHFDTSLNTARISFST